MIERLRLCVGDGNIYRFTIGMMVAHDLTPLTIFQNGRIPFADAVVVDGPWIVAAMDIPSEMLVLERGHERPGWLRRTWRRLVQAAHGGPLPNKGEHHG